MTFVFQKTLNEFFPSWEAVKWTHREVIIFSVGLMKDPTPLVDHVYEMYIDHYLRRVRIGGSYPTIDDYLFQSLYSESPVPLLGSPLNNHHINIYDTLEDGQMGRPFDESNWSQSLHYKSDRMDQYLRHLFDQDTKSKEIACVQIASKLYVFRHLRKEVVYDIKGQENTKVPQCTIEILHPHPAIAKTILTTCHEINRYQPVTDLTIDRTRCQDVTASETPIMSDNARALSLGMSDLPATFISNIVRQLVGSQCVTLQNCNFVSIDLSEVEDDLDELLDQVVSHHKLKYREQFFEVHYERDTDDTLGKRRLNLMRNNLSRDFENRWTVLCKRIPSIECSITIQDNASDFITFNHSLGTLNLNISRSNLQRLINKFSA